MNTFINRTFVLVFFLLFSLNILAEKKAIWTTPKSQFPFPEQIEQLNNEEIDKIFLGRSFFHIPWVAAASATTARDGLGPLFNANTCATCHHNLSHGKAQNPDGSINRALLFKLAQPSHHHLRDKEIPLVVDPIYGGQIAINGVKGVPFEATPRIKIQKIKHTLPDGTEVELKKFTPFLDNMQYGPLAKDTRISIRMAPVLVGMNLLDRVSDEEILSREDEHDTNGDGISGRANRVYNPWTKKIEIGKFGYKASQSSVLMQTADAAINDMGLTNPFFPDETCTTAQTACLNAPKGRSTPLGDLDLPMLRLKAIDAYVRSFKAPQTPKNTVAQKGQRIFRQVGCVRCHAENMTTKDGFVFSPYSDLLLHDMGEGLADERPEFLASKREWRTAPLWGLGAKVRHGIGLLHDARADTPLEAIMWHGGEASALQAAFQALSTEERNALLTFLESL